MSFTDNLDQDATGLCTNYGHVVRKELDHEWDNAVYAVFIGNVRVEIQEKLQAVQSRRRPDTIANGRGDDVEKQECRPTCIGELLGNMRLGLLTLVHAFVQVNRDRVPFFQ